MNPWSFDVVKFRLGAASDPTNQERMPFYEEIARLTSGGRPEYVGTGKRYNSISADTAMKNPAALYAPLDRALQAVAENSDVAILDLSEKSGAVTTLAIFRGKMFRHISAAIATALADERWNNERKLIVLLPERLSEQDEARRALANHLASRRVILVADDGTSTDPDFPSAGYRKAQEIVAPHPPLEEFRRRMITRLGWFRSEGTHGNFFRHYFDGSAGANYLDAVLEEYLGASTPLERPVYVIGHLSISPWLLKPLQGACNRVRLPFDIYEDALKPDNSRAINAEGGIVTLVVPMVRSGGSISVLAQSLEKRLRPTKLQILTVLIEQSNARSDGCHKIENDDGRVQDIHYLLPVSQKVVSESVAARWQAASDPDESPRSNLTTQEFWDLVRECGVKPEDDVPPRRSAYPIVPDLPMALDRYGPWLADKLWSAIRARTRTLRQNIVLASPRGEKGSSKLASCLTASVQANVVQIPREAIESVIEHGDANAVVDPDAVWYQELSSASAVVLIDEFVGDGKTMDAMAAIAQASDVRITAQCCLLDFSPSRSSGEVDSLYSWQASRSQMPPPAQRANSIIPETVNEPSTKTD
ncbi:hypothetical protein Rhe02_38010 [Rhizocola hellebori]|uniref:Uncharacterized protein n=1 Tax=Rhizocola hellebori TaxID=1392758 RepID=A0A8J3Q950_9ACTN|nr:hypothetical protein [Rhizocola hellebori]GIH05734.1 hypothetical protein Rhe02_38010 [Rhizocola hellebori]